jgi:hypothetical protein
MVDYLTKWPEVVALPDSKAKTVARAFVEQIVCRHGAPKSLLSDQGAQFMGDLLGEINTFLRVKAQRTTAYHPQTNGLVERFNGTLKGLLAKWANDRQDDWDLYVPYVLSAYRTSEHESTGDSPFYLLYGREPNAPIDISSGAPQDVMGTTIPQYRSELVHRLIKARSFAHAQQQRAQVSNQCSYNQGRTETRFLTGSKVLLYVPRVLKGRTLKLAKPWTGPYRINELRGKLVAVIQHVNNPKDVQTVNVRRLKPYHDGDSFCDSLERLRDQQEATEEVEIEAIVDSRESNGQRQYLVRYKGFSSRHNVWVNQDEVHADELLPLFERSRKVQRSKGKQKADA